ncbi:MAG: hypothetical protein QW802_00990 [Candidatus Altiarchaeota archaeon]
MMIPWGKIGAWSFVVGLVISILAGLGISAEWVPFVLVVLGVLVGILNIADKEVVPFLVGAIALMFSTYSLGYLPLGSIITAILKNINTFVAPAAAVVALRTIYDLAKEK